MAMLQMDLQPGFSTDLMTRGGPGSPTQPPSCASSTVTQNPKAHGAFNITCVELAF